MANAKQLEMSLLTEHLNYTPLSLLDEIINTVNEITCHAVDAVESGMQAADPADLGFKRRRDAEGKPVETDDDGKLYFPEAAVEIEDGANKLQTLLDANVDRNFDKLEIYVLRSVLSIPHELVPWVKLAHYEDIPFPDLSSSSSTPTPESIQSLRRQLQETRKLHSALNARVAQNNALLQQLSSMMSPVSSGSDHEPPSSESKTRTETHQGAYAFLSHTASAQSLGVQQVTASAEPTPPGPIETNTSFTLSQLPALRALIAELRPRLATLGATANGHIFPSGAERDRRLYLENQMRKVLERRGVAIGDAPLDELGRGIAPEERMALEAIVQGLSRGGDKMEE